LKSNIAFHEDWAKTRSVAALKAFTTVKSMISDEKLVYDRSSLYYDSDERNAGYMQKTPKKINLDDEDKKVFTCLPTCYAMFFAFNSKDASESCCPFACHNKFWQEKNSLESILDRYECNNRSFKADELRQHVSQNHSKSWCGMGVKLFLHELFPSPLTANKESIVDQNKRGNKKEHPFTDIYPIFFCT
jgi:hypothetical protein